MSEEIDVIIADNTPSIAGSQPASCDSCNRPVVLAPSGQRTRAEHPAARILCMRCGLELIREDPEAEIEPITVEQLRELQLAEYQRAVRRRQG